jgi:hypothetical protein
MVSIAVHPHYCSCGAANLGLSSMDFEWDEQKAAKNISKHGVSFHEAATVFGDPLALTFYDPDHSDDEDRYLTIGHSEEGKLIIISHTDREDRIRIISARRATRREGKAYEERE